MPKDDKPADARSGPGASGRGDAASSGRGSSGRAGSGTPGRSGSGSRPSGARGNGARGSGNGGRGNGGRGAAGKGGRTRPAANVVTPQRPWGLIAAAIAVVVFAAAVLTYAVLQARESEAVADDPAGSIDGVQQYDYAAGQEHVTTSVDYSESPPVGGPHDGEWADCTGTVYDADIRHENAVHSLEHGAVWVTYDPEAVSDDDIATLGGLVEGTPYRMMSPYAGQDSPISIQAWNHQLAVDSADDPRLAQFADALTQNDANTPEPGASCENPQFLTSPLVAGDPSRGTESMVTDPPSSPTGETAP
ncbi:DUF3105 domain-containing protein [Trujillonella humicola]|uniref:DUF3105 domain-containing protein n=1 Tax=Trujillonella humicola TaxID=3383699 RepID=UPI0039068B24